MNRTKNFLLNSCISVSVALFSITSIHAQPLNGWSLVWSDEFNAASLDRTKWQLEMNEGDHGETAYTERTQNLYIADGCLVLQAQKEKYSGEQYTSTQVSSRNMGHWKYGRFDIRAKLPYGQGMWPAIWMMPNNPAYGGWPRSGEIDIMENLGDNTRLLYSTLHHSASNAQIQGTYTTPVGQSLSDTFHVYTMIWDAGSFAFYIDSSHNYLNTKSWSPSNVTYPKPFDQTFFMMFDLAVGGSWGGLPDSSTVFPQKMLVDWIRVYKRDSSTAIEPRSESKLSREPLVTISGKWVELDLKTNVSANFSIHDMGGREVARVNCIHNSGLTRVPVPATLSRGFYVWKLVTDGNASSGRFVVE